MTGANAIGVPGWPELACCTASMESVRIVLMLSWSSSALISGSFRPRAASPPPRPRRGQGGLDQLRPLQIHVGLQDGAPQASDRMLDHVHITFAIQHEEGRRPRPLRKPGGPRIGAG